MKPPEETKNDRVEAVLHVYNIHKESLINSGRLLKFLLEIVSDLRTNTHYAFRFDKVNKFTDELFAMFPVKIPFYFIINPTTLPSKCIRNLDFDLETVVG